MNVTRKTIDLLQERKVFTTSRGKERFQTGDTINFNTNVQIEPYCMFSGNVIPNMGSFTYSWSQLESSTVVGRYCSLASSIRIFGIAHPYERFTSSSVTYDPNLIIFSDIINSHKSEPSENTFKAKPMKNPRLPIVIGNDVWIGQCVALKPGITIGNGAVIATGAIVTKDVPPYAVVGGIPAKVIKYRFSDIIIEQLQNLQWWKYSFVDFKNMNSDIDIQEFIKKIEQAVAYGDLKEYKPDKLTGEEILRTIDVID